MKTIKETDFKTTTIKTIKITETQQQQKQNNLSTH